MTLLRSLNSLNVIKLPWRQYRLTLKANSSMCFLQEFLMHSWNAFVSYTESHLKMNLKIVIFIYSFYFLNDMYLMNELQCTGQVLYRRHHRVSLHNWHLKSTQVSKFTFHVELCAVELNRKASSSNVNHRPCFIHKSNIAITNNPLEIPMSWKKLILSWLYTTNRRALLKTNDFRSLCHCESLSMWMALLLH